MNMQQYNRTKAVGVLFFVEIFIIAGVILFLKTEGITANPFVHYRYRGMLVYLRPIRELAKLSHHSVSGRTETCHDSGAGPADQLAVFS